MLIQGLKEHGQIDSDFDTEMQSDKEEEEKEKSVDHSDNGRISKTFDQNMCHTPDSKIRGENKTPRTSFLPAINSNSNRVISKIHEPQF